ncbi:MAG: amidase family protein, partial [Solirubrobacteraceae bacterium]|nr:amidase family protein [Solirubrobacteraceae bacterium]
MFRPIDELAAMVKSGEISALELVDTSLGRIDALNPTYNAFIDVFHDDARAQAKAVKSGDARPLAGVPVAIKNNRPIEGARLTFAADVMGDFRASHDAFLVRRLRDAGAIVVGTTNLPEFGILPT